MTLCKEPKTSSPIQAQDGGIFGTPCFCNSPITPSSAGALRPRGNGK